jgi:hypothetical protein
MKTYLIAGVNGNIGKEFARRLKNKGRIYGISRSPISLEGIECVQADLLKQKEVQKALDTMQLSEDITYIHLPGKFQFEDENHPIKDKDGDGIDDDTFETNYKTFLGIKPNLRDILIKNSQTKLKLVGIGSTSDLYNNQFWHSFTHSKNRLRQEFRAMYGDPETYQRVNTLFINVSTTDGDQLAGERPFISKRFVLTPREILNQSLPYILDERNSSVEISVLKPNPNFDGFENQAATKKRWYDEMYGS